MDLKAKAIPSFSSSAREVERKKENVRAGIVVSDEEKEGFMFRQQWRCANSKKTPCQHGHPHLCLSEITPREPFEFSAYPVRREV